MEILLVFFRDILSGWVYWLYLAFCIFLIFFILGFVADGKRMRINSKLKEKKKYDIESGREAAIAAMESKQVLDVDSGENPLANQNPNATLNAAINSAVQNNNSDIASLSKTNEEVPSVMVLNSDPVANTQQPNTSGAQVQEKVVIDSSSLQR